MLNLSPLARRRFERFKKNRRGWWSLWLFIGLFLLTLIGLLLTAIFQHAALIAGLLGVLGLIAAILAIVIAVWPGQWNKDQTGPRLAE